MIMTGEVLWSKLICDMLKSSIELQTKRGRWFKATSIDEKIYIEKAIIHTPTSKLKSHRTISKSDFLTVYPSYDRWISGEKGVRKKIRDKSKNTSYIYAIIGKFG